MTVDPQKAEGRLWTLWATFAKFYESHADTENARIIFEKATQVNYRAVDDLASVWCDWVEMELRHREYDQARLGRACRCGGAVSLFSLR